MQDCVNCATSLKAFNEDGRYDVICSGSLMGINYNEIESNSVGQKQDYEMYSLDFEEFLWAKGYKDNQIEDLYTHMKNLDPFSELELSVMFENFRECHILKWSEQGNFPYLGMLVQCNGSIAMYYFLT